MKGKISFRCVLILLVISQLAQSCNHQTGIELGVSRYFSVDTLVAPYLHNKNTRALSIAITDGLEDRFFNFGAISALQPERPTQQTIYEIGSITKTFTTTMLAQMVEEEKIELEGDITDYLPPDLVEWPGDRRITFLDLATHHSGLPRIPGNLKESYSRDPQNPYAHYYEKDLLDFLKNYIPEERDKRNVSYSNLGMGLLGHLLVSIDSEGDYESLVRQRILYPLKMESSFIQDTGQWLIPGHDEKGREVSSWEMPGMAGAGAIRSNTRDMLRYVKAQMLGKVGPDFLFKPYYRFSGDRMIALGWMSDEREEKGYRIIFHSGGTGGFRSFIGFISGSEVAVVVLANSAYNVEEIGMALLTGIMEKSG